MTRALTVACALALCSVGSVGCSDEAQPPKGPTARAPSHRKLPSPADTELFPTDQQEAARAVAAALKKGGEQPAEFHAAVQSADGGKTLIFHLWHISAIEEEERVGTAGHIIPGNPGGKCRDVTYDRDKKRVTDTDFWQ